MNPTKHFGKTALLLAPMLVSACTLKPGTAEYQLGRTSLNLKIQIPENTPRARTQALTTSDIPSSVREFSCFGVNVTGPGIAAAKESGTCSSGQGLPIGIYAGLVPLSGGEIQLTVPSGVPLVIQVFATITSDGTCSPFADVLARGTGTGPFYEVARTERTILTQNEPIALTVKFSPSEAKRAFCTVNDAKLGVWDQSKWGEATWGP